MWFNLAGNDVNDDIADATVIVAVMSTAAFDGAEDTSNEDFNVV